MPARRSKLLAREPPPPCIVSAPLRIADDHWGEVYVTWRMYNWTDHFNLGSLDFRHVIFSLKPSIVIHMSMSMYARIFLLLFKFSFDNGDESSFVRLQSNEMVGIYRLFFSMLGHCASVFWKAKWLQSLIRCQQPQHALFWHGSRLLTKSWLQDSGPG